MFLQGCQCIFQHDNAKFPSAPIIKNKKKTWLRKKRVLVLEWHTCSPDLFPREDVRRILKKKK